MGFRLSARRVRAMSYMKFEVHCNPKPVEVEIVPRRFAPSCGGSGIPENKAFLNGAIMPGLYSNSADGTRSCRVSEMG